ncbi:MAG: hypothetical protein GQ535_17625 [Rhodobacteraceae bacterium]|nr:hypothetical protein [Paracoccaceae bacterium]
MQHHKGVAFGRLIVVISLENGHTTMKTVEIGGKPVQLYEDEAIIWQGRPVQGVIRNPVHIGWGIVLLALGGWFMNGGGGPLSGTALGLPLAITGGYLVYFRAIVEKSHRASAYYILTNQRAILAYSLRVLAYPILADSQFTLKKGRFDTVLFAADQQAGKRTPARPRGLGFGHLENGDDVYNLMLGLQKNLKEAGS